MTPNEPSFIPVQSTHLPEIQALIAKGDGYWHIKASEIPSIVPEKLRKKWDSAGVVVAGSQGADGAFALIGHRIDEKVGQMDQHPLVLGVSASVVSDSGVFIDHATFESRSVSLPPGYIAAVKSSGICDYYKNNPVYGVSSGSTGAVPPPLATAIKEAREILFASGSATYPKT